MKKNIFLVLTPIRSTYPENYDGTILYLGNKDKKFLEIKNPNATIETMRTIWSDKKKLLDDNKYLENFEERFFKQISAFINNKLDLGLNSKYWDIYLRPSLYTLITTFYERWLTISFLKKKYSIDKCIFINYNIENIISGDTEKLFKDIQSNDIFNQLIYQNILIFSGINFTKKDIEPAEITNSSSGNKILSLLGLYFKKLKIKNFIFLSKLILKQFKNYILLFSIKKKKFFYLTHYIGDKDLRKKFNLLFKQKNFIFKIKKIKKNISLDLTFRNDLRNDFLFEKQNDFEIFFKKEIFFILPKCFIEYLRFLKISNFNLCNNYKFNLGIISTDQVYNSNFFELDWIAKNYMNGSKLLLAQNGGGVLTSECSTIKSLVKKLELKELVFGIEDNIKNKNYGVGFHRFKKKKNIFNRDGNIIYTLYSPYGYIGNMRSTVPLGSEWVEYISDHKRLISSLDNKIKNKIILRPKKRHSDYFYFKKELENQFPEIKMDNTYKPLGDMLKDSRLLITTLDTTTVLEGLATNFPTILICNFNHYKIADEFLKYYEKLMDVGIIHNNINTAKKHIENVFSDIDFWWNKNSTQLAREEFCKKIAYHPSKPNSFFMDKILKMEI